MASIEKPSAFSSFEAVLDTACEGLEERKILYSIRRIREMEENLTGLEKELDAFLEDRKKGSL